MIRTRIRNDQSQDIGFVSESELNEFFDDVVITGTIDETTIQKTFDSYFSGRGLIVAGSGVIVTTGTNFVQIDTTFSGSGITEQQHEVIDSLVHNLAETSSTSIIRNSAGQVVAVESRTAPVSGTLIRTVTVTRDSLDQVSAVTENQHDGNGIIIQTLNSTINRSQGNVVSIDTVET